MGQFFASVLRDGDVATMAFECKPEEGADLTAFMQDASAIDGDTGNWVWFQMEPETGLVWAAMSSHFYEINGKRLVEVAARNGLIYVEDACT